MGLLVYCEDGFQLLEGCYEENSLKIVLSILWFMVALLGLAFPALAETSNGSKIFSANCASCHVGGGNILLTQKTLEKEALLKYLENYDINPVQAIIYQLQNGKNAMPAYKDKLSEQEILEVATYVFQKAEQGW